MEFDSELLETIVLQADVVLDSGATETAGGVEAVQILVDAVTQSFPDSRVEVDSLDRPWFRFVNGHWSKALSRVWLLTPLGWITIYLHSGSRKLARPCQFQDKCASVPLRRSPSRHRFRNLLLWGSASRRLSHATEGEFSEDSREQNLNVSSALMCGLSCHLYYADSSARKSCTCQLTPNVVYSCLDSQISLLSS